MRNRISMAALLAAPVVLLNALALGAPASPAAGPVRVSVADAVLDRNGDGFQDVIVAERAAHFDVDADGRFDYTLSLAFKKYTSEGHRLYLESGMAADVFAELTRKGLDELCASERVEANWTAEHYREFAYYHDGYGRLRIMDQSPQNDGRLADPASRPAYEYDVSFNPDGTVASVRRGDRTVGLAAFDYARNVSTGTRLVLPKIGGAADLAAIRDTLGRLFSAAP